jgi:hypothetical protein
MATMKIGKGPGVRLGAGASILAAAKAIDTRLVKARLAAFERAHGAYGAAQRKVDAAEGQLSAAQSRLSERDAVQDEAVETLARALVADGQPRVNPFATFGAAAPTAIMRLPIMEETKAIHALVAAVQRNKKLSKPTLQAAQALDKAVHAVEQALQPLDALDAAVRAARHTRDAIGQTWDTALAALKRGARAAADDGAPQLYATLFDRPSRPVAKNGKPAPPPTAAAAPLAPAPPV